MKKNSNYLSKFILVFIVICSCFSFASCKNKHQHSYNEVVTSPTCTEQGYTTHTCECGETYKDTYTNPTSHNYEWVIDVQPTKTTTGLKHQECSICHDVQNANMVIDKLQCNHENKTHVAKVEANCTSTGKNEYWYCTECGKYFADENCQVEIENINNWGIIPIGDHSFGIWTSNNNGSHTKVCEINSAHTKTEYCDYDVVVTEPTCTEQGYTTHTCKICGYSYIDTYTSELGHTFGNWTSNNDGTHTRVCANDNAHTETESCDYNEVVTAPTCTEQGYTTHTCKICGYSYIDTYTSELGHVFGNWTSNDDGTHARVCANDNTHTETGNCSYSNGVCTVCEALEVYTITYNLDGGTNSENNPATFTVETETITLKFATKENYYFGGWFSNIDLKNQVIQIEKGTTGNIILYAKWNNEPPYNLKSNGSIDFGTYPQTKVTDSSLVSSLTTLIGTLPTESNSETWISYKYYIGTGSNNSGTNTTDFMWYKDISYNDNKYRAIYFTSYRPYNISDPSSTNLTYQDDRGYHTSTIYFFKFEPINWRILTESDGKALLMCNMIIDSQEYYNSKNSRTINGKTVYANNYAESNIRKWLNNNFYNTAFSELEKQLIQLTNIDNSVRSTNPNNNATEFESGNNSYACENTNDYIFLLSMQEVTNSAYGFNSSVEAYDTARQLKGTDYAKSQGLWVYTDSGYSYTGCSSWWLRSPYCNYNYSSWDVNYSGKSTYYGGVFYTCAGIVPALWINL